MLFSACTFDQVAEPKSPAKEVTVGISTSGAQTKTTMLSNGLSAVWEAGDQLAVWAKGSAGSYVLSNQIFETYGIDDRRGFFTSTLSSEMPQDTYTYYCCYPAPVSVDGSTATFNIPSTQDGKATGGADIMIATPVQHGPLKPLADPEDHSNMCMSMNRMMHQFRFYIPENNTVIGDEQITKIVLTFPRNVVGNTTLDLSNPDAVATLSESESASSQITLQLSEPLTKATANSANFACAVMNPVSFAEGEKVQVKAYTSNMIAQVDPIDLCARNFQAGHSTPVQLKVKAITDYPYQISFKLTTNNLGEKPNIITLAAPKSCVWEGYNSNVYTYAPGRPIELNETFTIRFESETAYRAFSNQNISVTYDSDNTITYQTVTVANLSSVNSTTVSLNVPYLFYQDFSSIPSFNDGHDNPGTGLFGGSDSGYKSIYSLGSKTSVLSGWYGTRIGGESGKAVRICCRYENVLSVGAFYKGRLYTPFLSNIKDGKDVKIAVSFRYGSNHKNAKKGKSVMYFGINTQTEITNPDVIEGDSIIDGAAGLLGGSGYASSNVTSLSPLAVGPETLATSSGSYTSFEGTKDVIINKVDNGMRLAWVVTTNETRSNNNANFWLYIDDIKVQITK